MKKRDKRVEAEAAKKAEENKRKMEEGKQKILEEKKKVGQTFFSEPVFQHLTIDVVFVSPLSELKRPLTIKSLNGQK